MQLKDKEILVQLALGTFNIFLLYSLVQETNNPTVLTAASKTFVKLKVGEGDSASPMILGTGDADLITSAFMNNEHTPPLVKSYIMVARQMKSLENHKMGLYGGIYIGDDLRNYYGTTIKSLQEKFEKLHQQLFYN